MSATWPDCLLLCPSLLAAADEMNYGLLKHAERFVYLHQHIRNVVLQVRHRHCCTRQGRLSLRRWSKPRPMARPISCFSRIAACHLTQRRCLHAWLLPPLQKKQGGVFDFRCGICLRYSKLGGLTPLSNRMEAHVRFSVPQVLRLLNTADFISVRCAAGCAGRPAAAGGSTRAVLRVHPRSLHAPHADAAC